MEALQLLRLVPEGYIPLPHQVGGHRHVDGKLGECRWCRASDGIFGGGGGGGRWSVQNSIRIPGVCSPVEIWMLWVSSGSPEGSNGPFSAMM